MSAPQALIDLFGPTLKTKTGTIATAEALADKEAVGIYFSAHWCGPCRYFTPQLCKKYTALKEAGKRVEIVFVSSDRDENAFNGYHAEQNFLALPFSDRSRKNELSSKYSVRGIPSLVFVDGTTGKTITTSGRGGISSDSFIEDFPYTPKPMYDLSQNADGINALPSLVVLGEHSDADTKSSIKALVLETAVNELKQEDPRASKFFTGIEGGPVSQIRRNCKLPMAPPPKHKYDLVLKEDSGNRWYCDGCGTSGAAAKQRWTCSEGTNFDYCEVCNATAGNPPPVEATEPTMLILNLAHQGAFYVPAEGKTKVNAENIDAFLTAFKNGELSRKQWGA